MLNVLYSDTEGERRPFNVGSDVAPGTPLIAGTRPAITITGSGDYNGNAVTLTSGAETLVVAGGRGGVSLDDEEATITFTGSYFFPVVGATTALEGGETVYITSAGALTLTEATNTKYGEVVFHRGELSSTDTAVTIGINLG